MMSLNKQTGNMYPWVTHTWNVIKGRCPHNCSYCYMKQYPQPELHFDDKELKTDLGSGNTIFVGSSCDMWAQIIPYYLKAQILDKCFSYSDNDYLFQSKNPGEFKSFDFPEDKVILGTTIETNRTYTTVMGVAPAPLNRYLEMKTIFFHKMVSIEPIMDFDLPDLVRWMKEINPQFVSIGADSKGHHLPEPLAGKVLNLINELKKFTEVKVKSNLNRIIRRSK